MKALIYILAIVLMAAGVAVGLMSFFSPGEVVLGLNLGLAATLLTGGVVTLALAGVMTAVSGLRRQINRLAQAAAGDHRDAAGTLAPPADGIAMVVAGGAGAATTAAAPAAAEETEKAGEAPEVAETPVPTPAEEAEAEEAAEAEAGDAETEAEAAVDEAGAEADVDGLYVVEERIIRNRPARMLSDGTVEAETDEGWMRFENLEHLEEYLEAMSHAR
jgi:hypothetical protein